MEPHDTTRRLEDAARATGFSFEGACRAATRLGLVLRDIDVQQALRERRRRQIEETMRIGWAVFFLTLAITHMFGLW